MKRIDTGIRTALAAAFALAACNDGAFVPKKGSATGTAEGVYTGTLTDSPSGATHFAAIVLANGSFWRLYGEADATSFTVEGFARGSGTSGNGEFTSAQGTDFGFTPPVATTLEAEYDTEAGTIEGTYTTTAGVTGFAGGPIADSDYDYDAAPDVALLEGMWEMPGTDGVTYTLEIGADGTFDFEEPGGCTGTGAFTAHSSGRNLLSVSVEFGNVVECALPGETVSGIALAYTVTSADAIQLIAAVNDGLSTFGVALSGTLPLP